MATTHPQSETRRMPVRLSVEEVAGKADELAAKVKEAREQEDVIAEKEASWKRTKKAMTALLNRIRSEANDLADVVETGQEEGEVVCDWLYALNMGWAFLVRRDTLELVSKRQLREEERQMVLGEVLQEPTDEQLAEWADARPRECGECGEPTEECLCGDPEAEEADEVLRGHVPFGSGEYGGPEIDEEEDYDEGREGPPVERTFVVDGDKEHVLPSAGDQI